MTAEGPQQPRLRFHPVHAASAVAGPEAFDALTDLFLGETEAPGAPIARPVSPPPLALTRPDEPASESIPSSVETPAPPTIRVRSTPAAPAAASAPSSTSSTPRATTGRSVEIVLAGHLPLMASAWASHYARLRQRDLARPLGILRLFNHRLIGEVLASPAAYAAPVASHEPGPIIRAVAAAAPSVLILAGDGQPDLALADALTLLSSADEAGTVAAYQTIKRLAHAREHAPARDLARPIRLAIMGADDQRARAAWRKLKDACESFLGVHLEWAGCSPRVEGGCAATFIGESAAPVALADVLSALAQASPFVEPPAAGTPHPPASDLADALAAIDDLPAHIPEAIPSIRDHAFAASEPASTLETPVAAEPVPVAAAHTPVTPAPASAAAPSPALPTPASPIDLCRFIDLKPMRARCPFAADVQLGVDAAGVLHLLARASSESAHAPQSVVSTLVSAAAWATLNRELLALTFADPAALRLDASPVLHLFTDQPREARRLLDSDIRLHVLAPVTPIAHWACAALN